VEKAPSSEGQLLFLPALAGLLLSLLVNFRSYLIDFNLVPGDLGDSRLMVFTLEHWFSVFRGQESFYSLRMFHPDPLALAYADGLFLFGIPYSALRALGLDYFTSYQLLLVFLTAVGYIAWLALLRRGLRLRASIAVLGAILLTSLNALQVQADIGKLTAVHFFPLLIWLLWLSVEAKAGLSATLAAAGFAAGLGLLFFTSYYPAWFLFFTLILFAALAFLVEAFLLGPRIALSGFRRILGGRWQQLSLAVVVLLLSLAPFFATYAPLVASDASRQFSLVLEFTPTIQDVINVSPLNYIWSPVLRALAFDFRNREVQMGSPILVALLALITALALARRVHRQGWRDVSGRDRLLVLLAATALAIVVISVKVNEVSLWYLVYRVVPGASALRALGRILMIVDMIFIVLAICGLDDALSIMSSSRRVGAWYLTAGAAFIAAALVAEQVNAATFRLDKASQLSFMRRVRAPEAGCDAFYINHVAVDDLPIGYYQLDAIMIGMQLRIPTVNGYSGIEPHEAFRLAPMGVEYKYQILDWLQGRGATEGICELALRTSTFRPVDVAGEYEEARSGFQAELLGTFAELYEAAVDFLADGNSIMDLYPQYLQERGYLDASLGYETGPRYRWIQQRYWMGSHACGNKLCVGIGVVGRHADLSPVFERYGSRAKLVYFPDHNRLWDAESIADRTLGEALFIFPVDVLSK
jgi:hypothetical protein